VIVLPVPDGALGFDTFEPLSLAALDVLARASYGGEIFHFVVRYVENLTVPEIENILERQLGLMTVGVAPNDSMHAPSAVYGSRDGLRAVTKLRALGILKGVTHSLDVEGEVGATKEDVILYVNAAFDVLATQTESCMYDGWADPLSAAELYHDLKMTRYWAASPKTLAPAVRGFGLVQEVENVKIGGYAIDVNRHHIDGLGESFHMLVAGDPS
jgi:hypothetical protein